MFIAHVGYGVGVWVEWRSCLDSQYIKYNDPDRGGQYVTGCGQWSSDTHLYNGIRYSGPLCCPKLEIGYFGGLVWL